MDYVLVLIINVKNKLQGFLLSASLCGLHSSIKLIRDPGS